MSHESDRSPGLSRRHFLQRIGVAALAQGLAAPPAGAAEPDTPSGRKTLPLGVTSYSFRKFDLDQALAMTKRVGLKRISLKAFHLPLDATPEQIAAVVDKIHKADLELTGVGVITMHKKAEVDQGFDYAKAAGVKMIVAAPTAEMLPLIEEKVRGYDIAVAIHNHGPTDKYFPTPESVYQKVKDLDRRIGLCIDIGHTVRVGADLVGSVRQCGDRLLDVHMKDVTAATPQGKELPVGRGIIDIPGFLRALLEVLYPGTVTFEYEADPQDPLAGLAESVGYTRGVLAAL